MTPPSKLRSLNELAALRNSWRDQGKTVVWTNGVFDLVHAGHIRSLRGARAFGDILIVGLNSDAGTRANKGPLRPLMNQDDRAELLSALEMVDAIVIFDESEPSAILARLQPDVHCKGEEYSNGQRPIPEQAVVESYGGQVKFLPLLTGRSTTSLLEKYCAASEADKKKC